MKKTMALKNGITLIDVPYWWDATTEKLLATIQFQRPDLFSHGYSEDKSIQLNPPSDHVKETCVPEVGELMLASFSVAKLSVDFQEHKWWIGEKYDGLRCCWNTNHHKTYTRYGREILLHNSLFRFFPESTFIDSELWFGRGDFYSTSLILREPQHSLWPWLRVLAFDIPSYDMQKELYEDRYSQLVTDISFDNPLCIIAMRLLQTKSSLVPKFVQMIIEEGGEGVILQQVASLYEQGRSSALLKIKTAQADQEGIVESFTEDKSVILKLPNGNNITVPVQDVNVNNVKVGDVVTFSYESNIRRELPTNPCIYRIRTDLIWEDVLRSYKKEKIYEETKAYTVQAFGYWTPDNMRSFMEQFATKHLLDPLNSNTWRLLHRQFHQSREGRAILRKFKHGYSQALQVLFPEIIVDENYSHKYKWQSIESRRRFFEKYANKMGFDPQVPENWYKESLKSTIRNVKGYQTVLMYHDFRLSKALIDLFPNIGLDKSKIRKLRYKSNSADSRRKYFELYARKHGFDPLNPENWYLQSKHKIEAFKGMVTVLFHHNNSVPKALLDLFPNIGLDASKLARNKSLWYKVERRKQFFETYAKQHGFNPLVPENWYMQNKEQILSVKGSHRILFYHGSITKALLDLFPNIGLEKDKFKRKSGWHNVDNRRDVFIEYAAAHQFDPLVPENWYIQSKDQIKNFTNVRKVLSFHEGSISGALCELFPDIGLNKEKLIVNQSAYNSPERRRRFFEQYALKNGFDPLVAENWYWQTRDNIISVKGARGVLYFHRHSVSKALCELFPEIDFDLDRLNSRQYLWQTAERRRKFFENYAESKGFDPLIAENWYNQPRDSIISIKGALRILEYHDRSLSKALLALFPDIGLDRKMLQKRHSLWSNPESRKSLFITYAKENGFDPLVADNWYSEPKDKIRSTKGFHRVVAYHGNSVAKALLDLFPDIGLDKAKFSRGLWNTPASRRDFFNNYAKSCGFDPNDPQQWYLHASHKSIMAKKGAGNVLAYHGLNIPTALLELYPDIGLERSKLHIP